MDIPHWVWRLVVPFVGQRGHVRLAQTSQKVRKEVRCLPMSLRRQNRNLSSIYTIFDLKRWCAVRTCALDFAWCATEFVARLLSTVEFLEIPHNARGVPAKLAEILRWCPRLSSLKLAWQPEFDGFDWTQFLTLRRLEVTSPARMRPAQFRSWPPGLVAFSCSIDFVGPAFPETLREASFGATHHLAVHSPQLPPGLHSLSLWMFESPRQFDWKLPNVHWLRVAFARVPVLALDVWFDHKTLAQIESLELRNHPEMQISAATMPRLRRLKIENCLGRSWASIAPQLVSLDVASQYDDDPIVIPANMDGLRSLSIITRGIRDDLSAIRSFPRLKNLELRCPLRHMPCAEDLLNPNLERLVVVPIVAEQTDTPNRAELERAAPSCESVLKFLTHLKPGSLVTTHWFKN